MPYLTLRTITCNDSEGTSHTHEEGIVLSDWEVSEVVQEKVRRGDPHTCSLLEPITEDAARTHRSRMTTPRTSSGGDVIQPPWDDFVGLHPSEIIARLNTADLATVKQAKQYEAAGLQRQVIMEHIAPAERPPFVGYNEASIRDILERMSMLDPEGVQRVIVYEMSHQRRPAIIEYDPGSYDGSPSQQVPAAA